MTAFTSVGSGNWTDPATWDVGGGRYPGDGGDAGGDTADIQDTHVVDLDADITSNLGTDGGTGTTAVTVRSGGRLNRNGFALTMQGDLFLERGFHLTGNGAGAHIEFDSGTAGARYMIVLSETGSGRGTWTETGALHQIRTASGSAGDNAWIEKSFSPAGRWTPADIDWGSSIELVDMGDSGQPAIDFGLEDDESFVWSDGLMLRCGQHRVNVWDGQCIHQVLRLDVREPQGPPGRLTANSDLDVPGGGIRQFDASIYAATETYIDLRCRDFTVSGVWVNCGELPGTACRRLNTDGLFLIATEDEDPSLDQTGNSGAVIQNSAAIIDGGTNPHWFGESGDEALAMTEMRDFVVDGFGRGTFGTGDLILGAPLQLTRVIGINHAGNITLLDANARLYANRITWANNAGDIRVGEGTGDAEHIQEVINSLFDTLEQGMLQDGAFVTQTSMRLAYNAYNNMTDTANLDHPAHGTNSYVGPESVAAWKSGASYGDVDFGASDLSEDPQFVDGTRTANTWLSANSGGTLSTLTDLARECVKVYGRDYQGNTAAFDSNYSLQSYLDYIRGGYTPTNSALQGAGEGGVDIGAVDVQASTSVTDTAAVTASAASILAASETGNALDTAVITAALASVIQGVSSGIAEASASLAQAAAAVLSAQDNGIATDQAAVTSAQASVLNGVAQAIANDAAAIVTATATPLTASLGDTVTDTAAITSVGAAVLQAQASGVVTDDAQVSAVTITILASTETAQALDGALIVNAQGQPIAAIDSAVSDVSGQIITATVTPLTAILDTGAQYLTGTVTVVPVLSGSPSITAALQGDVTIKPH